MTKKRIEIVTTIFSLLLLISLIIELLYVPGGIILPAIFLGGIILIGILLGCIIVAALLKLVFKKYSFLILYSITTAISFLVFHYYLYSPTLKIIVPKGYTGEVNLVLSNVNNNILTIDSNGIGYINKWTYRKTYSEPIVIESDGKKVNNQCIRFNPSTFWAKGSVCCFNGREVQTMSFEIAPKTKKGEKQYYDKDITKFLDSALILTSGPYIQTTIQVKSNN